MVYSFRRTDMYPSLLDLVIKMFRSFALTALNVAGGPKPFRLQALRSVCSEEPEALQTIIDYLNITSEEARAVFSDMPLPQLKKLAERYEISKDVAVQAFVSARRRGDVDTARWLAREFQLVDLAERGPGVLRGALSRGNLELVKWLIETYKITRDSVSDMFEIEELIASIIDPEVVEYMISTYDIDRDEGFKAFECACHDGNLECACHDGNLECACHDGNLECACHDGNLDCAEVLEKVFRFGPNEVRKGNRLLRECAGYGYIKKWLLDTYYI